MLFWVITIMLALAVAGPIARALLRARRDGDAAGAAQSDLGVYRDQLREVERDRERGVIGDAEAERLRTEVSRRLLAADAAARTGKDTADTAPRRLNRAAAAVLVLAILGGALALYSRLGAPGYGDLTLADRIDMAEDLRRTRPGQEEAEKEALAARPDRAESDPEFAALMDRLRTALQDRPDDLRGHRLLAENEAARGNFVEAREAQAQVIRIRGEDAEAADYADLADLMIQAAGGYVSPEAEQALYRALQRDETNGIARYYYGLMMGQIGRPDRGFRIWRQLLNDSAPDDPWTGPLRARIEAMADRAGVRYSLPEASDLRGPSQADIEAAGEMDDEGRQEMIRGMVEGLAARLGSEGGSPEEWARLIGALGVLGETERAREIWDEARQVFAGDETALARLATQAERAGLTAEGTTE